LHNQYRPLLLLLLLPLLLLLLLLPLLLLLALALTCNSPAAAECTRGSSSFHACWLDTSRLAAPSRCADPPGAAVPASSIAVPMVARLGRAAGASAMRAAASSACAWQQQQRKQQRTQQ
jgi:hypothetical protein